MSQCQYCQEKLKGRSDKKFCSDYCRTTFHNQRKQKESFCVRFINRVLRRNRWILYELYIQNHRKIAKEELLIRGYNPKFSTHQKMNTEGTQIKCCYDMAYSESDSSEIKLFKVPNIEEWEMQHLFT